MELFSLGFFTGFFIGCYVIHSMRENEMVVMEESIKELEAKNGTCKCSCT